MGQEVIYEKKKYANGLITLQRTNTYAIVDSVVAYGKKYLWFEVDYDSADVAPCYDKFLIPAPDVNGLNNFIFNGDLDVLMPSLIVDQTGPRAPLEMDIAGNISVGIIEELGWISSDFARVFMRFTHLRDQHITTPAGAFLADKYSLVDTQTNTSFSIWFSPQIPFSGVVKILAEFTDSDNVRHKTEMVVKSYRLTGAKTKITTPPEFISEDQARRMGIQTSSFFGF